MGSARKGEEEAKLIHPDVVAIERRNIKRNGSNIVMIEFSVLRGSELLGVQGRGKRKLNLYIKTLLQLTGMRLRGTAVTLW